MNYKEKYIKYKLKYLNLLEKVGGKIDVRAKYEYEVYKYCNEKLIRLLNKNTFVYGYIKEMVNKTILDFVKILYSNEKLEEFKNLYNTKTESVLSGAIDMNKFVIDILPFLKEKDDDSLNNYLEENMNIRSGLTLLDMFVKYIIGKSTGFNKISKFFDDEIRIRESHTNIDKNNERDELCLNNFIGPKKTIEGKKECLPMIQLIETYTSLENSKYADDKLENFNVGTNIFTAPQKKDTVDVFAAGLSGHTIDIMLLFNVFVFRQIKREKIFLLVLACLIWMLNYYHHSFREIVGIAFIFVDDNDSMNKLLNLFKLKKNMEVPELKEIFDTMFSLIEKEITSFKDIRYEVDYPKVNEDILFNALLKGHAEQSIKDRLKEIDIKGKMVKFLNILHSIKTNQDLYIELP